MDYAWWINRKDGDGHNVFEGGFLGLDNISVFDRSLAAAAAKNGVRPALAAQPPFAASPHWQGLLLFYEYFHADTGQGLGAAHQTGWTGLLANLVMRRYRKDIPEFWSCRAAALAGAPKTTLRSV